MGLAVRLLDALSFMRLQHSAAQEYGRFGVRTTPTRRRAQSMGNTCVARNRAQRGDRPSDKS